MSSASHPTSHRTYFHSDALVWAEYDEEARELTIRLTTRKTYRYYGVPDWEYDRLITAESAGRYYNLQIKTHGYRYDEITGQVGSSARARWPVAKPSRRTGHAEGAAPRPVKPKGRAEKAPARAPGRGGKGPTR
jgi:hypothetical protein